MTPTFNLIDEPWIRVQSLDGAVTERSIMHVFEEAAALRQILGDLPTQSFALYRLLLAIMYRATAEQPDRWAQWWSTRELPVAQIGAYLTRFHGRFDLLDPKAPFYQVADLRTQKNEFTELTRLIADAGSDYLSTKSGEAVTSLSFAEAARWLVHCHAFDVSGIKSGAVGDPRVKNSKGYPIGMGSAGHIGGVLLEGENLLETLLLNFVPQKPGTPDFAAWEIADEFTAAPRHREDLDIAYRPRGRAEVLTWQTRRVRLRHDGSRVDAVLITNGDRFSAVNLRQVEMMTAWRESAAQARKHGGQAFMPVTHQPDRAVWRGLTALLSSDTGPGTLDHLSEMIERGVLDDSYVPRLRAVGAHYVSNASVLGDVIDDEIAFPVRILTADRGELRQVVIRAVQKVDKVAVAYANLVADLDRAAGGEAAGRSLARERFYALLDEPFRRWVDGLRDSQKSAARADLDWSETLWRAAIAAGSEACEVAGPAAWVGRVAGGRHVDTGSAELWFRRELHKILQLDYQESA
ncbi:type I-E CRISPR-associated protein Cse1/CasA [Aeromicrobium camelliae]|uniref:Type I-E CRISPR-associated protein Cse1/CasA n=1 Tax=Aeromicrobium camelliae TaxID=1538144 RepID=A0A3N6WNC3_9ACTN|nr:type I-E CRISPR-associated protein Cse1/CasA [Aeromicrobium camelliae]RQN08800.1 type I-E CRISPR-associated protein Cse1/CasA [Aeromicrobium camelliae]